MKRLCIYAKDVQMITGKGERFARKIIKQIKQKLGKKPHQFVSIKEFCDYVDLQYEEVYYTINNRKPRY